jgi:hypothetical protein
MRIRQEDLHRVYDTNASKSSRHAMKTASVIDRRCPTVPNKKIHPEARSGKTLDGSYSRRRVFGTLRVLETTSFLYSHRAINDRWRSINSSSRKDGARGHP